MFKSPGYIAFSFLSIDVYWYGIVMSLAILIGIITILIIKNKFYKDISNEKIFDISFILIIVGILFARLYYVILDYKYFINHPFFIPCIWNGGISIHGAILGGIIAFYFYAKKYKLDYLKYADLFSFGLVVGQIIGRWGNFFNSEAFGLPCNLPWKLYIPYNMRPLEFKNYEFFHPAFLYESILNFLILLIMLYILNKKSEDKNGVIFFTYLFLYSIVRIVIETIRLDSVLNISNFHFAHIASLIFVIFSLFGLVYVNLKKN